MTTTRCVLWIALASVGCASPVRSLREDNRKLTQSVADMRADRRIQDRKIRDLEHQLAQIKASATPIEQVPALPVEVMAPPVVDDGRRVVGVADDGDEIVYEGDAALGRPAVADRSGGYDRSPPLPSAPAHGKRNVAAVPLNGDGGDRLEVTRKIPPVSAARATKAPVRSDAAGAGDGAASEYRAAVELVKSGKTEEAVTALRAFLKSYPRHEYADNAQYWLGEAYYGAKDYQHALVEFRATIEVYPRGNKVPDALLKVGYCYSALGQTEKARAVLEQVVNLYPKSEPAALAAKRLESP